MTLPDDLLARSATEAARRIALGLLDEAAAADRRLGDPSDAEALHDFRVAVRRLRSCVRAHARHLELSKKRRRELRELQRATGPARDTEVQLEWLRGFADELTDEERAGYEKVLSRLEKRYRKAMDGVAERVRRQFRRIHKRLRGELAVLEVELLRAPPERFGAVLGGLARTHAAELASLLESVRSPADEEPLHDARIADKRLRYLIEPVRGMAPGAKELVKRLKALQDVLGDLHDMHVLDAELAQQLEHAKGELQPGMEALRRLAQGHAEALYGTLAKRWLGEGVGELVASVDAFAGSLDGGGSAPLEIERKFLLRALPEEARAHPSALLEQGYVPGEQIHERMRRVVRGEAVSYKRTIKLGAGIERLEFEEETSAAVFEAMWPLTEGRRVRKRRYRVPAGELVWEVDEFLDRELFLAEVELPAKSTEAPLPSWLQPHVEREVTGEAAYVNLRLAR